jgi:NAD(P)-dependent dehydrogenase (short-subunit alcohol dehydrogenase family)
MAHTNKTVLVTGVSRGIGRGVCRHLATLGYTVHGTYNTGSDEADELKQDLGDRLLLYKVDFGERSQTQSFLQKVKTISFDGIVNNAGIVEFENFEEFDFSIWDRTIEINLTTPLLIAQCLSRGLNAGSAIVNIASTDGMTGTFASLSYAASKAALINLTKSLGNILGSRGVRVNAIAPGWINTGMATKASLEAVELTPLGRNGLPEDVAHVVAFLLSDDSKFVNGATLIVDGGYTNVDYIMMKEAKGEI